MSELSSRVIAAQLNSFQRSRVDVGINKSASGEAISALSGPTDWIHVCAI